MENPARHALDARLSERLLMVRDQLETRGITDRRVLDAMARVPRERFVLTEYEASAYDDRALPLECGQTVSQPYIVGLMTQALELSGRERVLEIGTGSGYQAAVLAELAAEVVTIERMPALAKVASARLAALGYQNVTCVVGDGRLGWPPRAPYDRAIITAAAHAVSVAIAEQVVERGLIVAPLGDRDEQVLYQARKIGGELVYEPLTGCRFVPLLPGTVGPEPPAT